ncbi:MAG TPA: methyltransferase domain-containing protein [Thermomicrobiaceae bacterium]|nr:methyltransferase domain-containing protein [Thermomicrobiaceae bacterium]
MNAAYCPNCGGDLIAGQPCALCAALQAAAEPATVDAAVSVADVPPAAFDLDAAAYERYLDTGRGRLRQELAFGNLLAALPDLPVRPRRVLDLGGGGGRLAVRLARLGHDVELVDPSPEMIRLAKLRAASSRFGDSIACTLGSAELLSGTPARYELIILHNVLEYVVDPVALLAQAAAALSPGGYLSLLCANRLARPVLRALAGNEPGVLAADLTRRTFPTDLFGGSRNEYAWNELLDLIEQAGFEPVTEHGVLVFTGLGSGLTPPPDEIAWLQLELSAGRVLEFLGLARYVQLIARRTFAGDE